MEKKQHTSGGRFFFGFILLLLGLAMILYRSGVLDNELYDFLLSWKMLMVAIGAFVFFSGNKSAGIIVTGIGVFFMLPDIFDDYDQIKRFFWPAIILLVGLSFMLGGKTKQRIRKQMKFDKGPQTFGGAASGGSTVYNEEFFDEFVIFGGREVSMNSSTLVGGKMTAIFGGADIDLRQCLISQQGCSIEVTTLFGGNVLKVPNDWTVLNKVTTIFGGYTDQRIKDPSYAPNPSKTIVITGVCIFGGTEIRNYHKAH